jgi:EmrB/QacA subfamily drug resistance transporter
MSRATRSSPRGDLVTTPPPLTWGEPRARWVLAATVLGSALSFIDATVVTIALPHIGADLGAGTVGLTWVVNAYTLTLAALVLLGGALGDRVGRRTVFLAGTAVFAVASALCGLAPTPQLLVAARALQGVGGALVTPASLALLQSSFSVADRGRAISAWSGLTGVAGAVGPFLGGWLVQVADWRWVFLVNLPVAALVVVLTWRHVPESRDRATGGPVDVAGAVLLAGTLGSLTYGLTALSSAVAGSAAVAVSLTASVILGGCFLVREHTAPVPLLPLTLFKEPLFVATNLVTLAVYAALGALFFTLALTLQVGAGFSPLAAGLSLLPLTVLMLLFSAPAGTLATRVGPRIPMTVGTSVAALGILLLGGIDEHTSYVVDVLGPVSLLGIGLTLLVGPLTATVLAAAPDSQAGLASGVNNAVARTAGLLAVAVLPLATGWGEGGGLLDPEGVLDGFGVVARLCAGLFLVGAVLSVLTGSGRQHRAEGRVVPARPHCSLTSPPAGIAEDSVSR